MNNTVDTFLTLGLFISVLLCMLLLAIFGVNLWN